MASALDGCGAASAGDGHAKDGTTPSASTWETASTAAIPGDGTWEVGSDVEPGVRRLGRRRMRLVAAQRPRGRPGRVIARGLLPRLVVEIAADDVAFRSEN
jgi:hypothetical protein